MRMAAWKFSIAAHRALTRYKPSGPDLHPALKLTPGTKHRGINGAAVHPAWFFACCARFPRYDDHNPVPL